MKRSASAEWLGTMKKGRGKISSESGALGQVNYTHNTRFDNEVGTNPEELIAAALAGCFSMAFAHHLEAAGFIPEFIRSEVTVSLERLQENWSIPTIDLDTSARVPGATEEQVMRAASIAKLHCPVAKLLYAKINLRCTLLPEIRLGHYRAVGM